MAPEYIAGLYRYNRQELLHKQFPAATTLPEPPAPRPPYTEIATNNMMILHCALEDPFVLDNALVPVTNALEVHVIVHVDGPLTAARLQDAMGRIRDGFEGTILRSRAYDRLELAFKFKCGRARGPGPCLGSRCRHRTQLERSVVWKMADALRAALCRWISPWGELKLVFDGDHVPEVGVLVPRGSMYFQLEAVRGMGSSTNTAASAATRIQSDVAAARAG